jgi:hypothetical protein
VAEQGCLLSSYTSKGCRGFESPPLRHFLHVRAHISCEGKTARAKSARLKAAATKPNANGAFVPSIRAGRGIPCPYGETPPHSTRAAPIRKS